MPKRLKNSTTDEIAAPPQGDPFQKQLSAYMAKLGAKGGRIGGKRRLKTMTKAERVAVAKKAAASRWKKSKAHQSA